MTLINVNIVYQILKYTVNFITIFHYNHLKFQLNMETFFQKLSSIFHLFLLAQVLNFL